MTEPGVASSDATNMEATAVVDGDEVVINGRKWWSTGVGHPDCKILVFMGLGDPDADRHHRHTMVLVPRDTPGVKVERLLSTMNEYDAPVGHGEVSFDDVRVPKDNILLGEGRAFEIAQGRLGPGRVHHCMRLIGQAEVALELAIKRGLSRTAFGKPIVNLGGNRERIADARIAIDQARLLVLNAAWKLDEGGPLNALSEVSQIKVSCRTWPSRSSTWRCSCTAAAVSPPTSRSPGCGPTPARCGWPTGPTRCTAASSPGSRSRSTDERRSWSPAARLDGSSAPRGRRVRLGAA